MGYQRYREIQDFIAYPRRGDLYPLKESKLHLHKSIHSGPSVVFESGLGCMSADWDLVTPLVDAFASVVTYDRAGMGWSLPHQSARESRQMVKELHDLLEAANIPKPYLLVGHSLGGCNVQLFAATYPNEVSGLVLVDPCPEGLFEHEIFWPVEKRMNSLKNHWKMSLYAYLGLCRQRCQKKIRTLYGYLPQSLMDKRIALISSAKHINAWLEESGSLSTSLKQIQKMDRSNMKHIPCILLSAREQTDLAIFGVQASSEQEKNLFFEIWNQGQLKLLHHFEVATHIIVDNSDHMILWQRPDAIASAILKMIEQTAIHSSL